MRILCICQYYSPEPLKVTDVCQGLREQGHTVEVMTGYPNYPEGRFAEGYNPWRYMKEVHEGIILHRVPIFSRMKGKSWQMALNYVSFAVTALWPVFRLRREHYDLIFVYQLSPLTMAVPAVAYKWLTKTPILMVVLDLWPESIKATKAISSPKLLAVIGKGCNLIYRSCDMILLSSAGFINEFRKLGISEQKLRYWPQWAEEACSIEPVVPLARLPQGFIVMFAGNIGVAQSFATIISASEILRDQPDIHWVFIGDGRMREWAEDETIKRDLTECVHFFGRWPAADMPSFFAQADALLVTLKDEPAFALTLPAKVQSYLACGKPLLASAGEGVRKVVEDAKAGLVCPPENSDGLARIVLELYLMEPEQRKRMGENGKQYYAANFSRKKLLSEIDSIMQQVAVGGPS